jgi:opacity protein-like surface antigen
MNLLKWNGCALFSVLFVLHSQSLFASNTPSANNPASPLFGNFAEVIKSSWVLTASLGTGWESAGDTQFFLAPDIQKTFAANRSTHSFVNGDLFLGIQHALRQNLQGQIGLEVAHTGDADLTGNVWDDADANFNNYTYKYAVQQTRIALKGQLIGDLGLPVQPWISAAVGVGFNRSYDFSNSPTIFEAIPMPNFTSHTRTAFTYTVGIGVERELMKHWKVGLGYEFADWGKSQLGRASGQTQNGGLALSHLYTSSVLLGITYQA